MIYVLALLLAYSLCFGIQQKLWPPIDRWMYARYANYLRGVVQCSYCVGFHCGWISWLMIWATTNQQLLSDNYPAAGVVTWALISAVSCYMLDTLATFLESRA